MFCIGSLTNGTAGGGAVVIGPTGPLADLTVSPPASTTFSGSFSGEGSLQIANTSATLTLTGASNGGNIGTIGGDLTLCDCFGGGLTISGGALTVNGLGQGVVIDGGTLSVLNGGTLQDNADLLVAGAMVVSGPGSSATVAGFTGIGIITPGTLTVSNGGTLNSQGGAEVDALVGTASVTVTGAGSTWNVGAGLGGLVVGGGTTGGPGTLTIANGGQVNGAGIVAVGDPGPGTSFITVTGSGSTLTATGGLVIGQTGTRIGTLNVAAGGVVNAAGGTSIGTGSTLNLGTGGLSGAIATPAIVNDGAIVANFTDTLTLAAVISGAGTLGKAGTGTLTLTGNNSYTGGTTINGGTISVAADANLGNAAGTLAFGGGTLQTTASFTTSRATTLNAGSGIFNTASGTTLTHGGVIGGTGALTKSGTGTLTLTGNNLYSGGTTVTGGLINFAAGNNLGTGTITLNGGGLQWATGNTTDISSRLAPLGAGGATIDTNGNAVRFATGLTGSGGLTKNGGGALFLLANNTYTGGTTVNGGILHIGAEGGPPGSIVGTVTVNGDDSHIAFLSTSSAGNLAITLNGGTGHFFGNSTGANATITANAASTWFIENSGSGGQARFIVNAGGAFDISPLAIAGTTAGSIEGAGAVRLGTKQLSVGANNLSTTVSGVIADGGRNGGTGGSLVKVGTGTLTLSGANTFTGGTTVNTGGLVVNGSLASTVTLNGGMLGGSGTIGGLVANGGTLAPGNSIGTLNVSGNFTQSGGTYQVEANAQGQSDRVNVSGTATINGGTVQLVAAPGNYGISTTYTILNATGGVAGAYSGVSSNFAFLTPSLTYNANNVFLTLALQGNAFSGFSGNTVNQRNVGYALDQSFANASGDFATVIGALAGLSTTQGPAALNAISGQPYADFGTTNVANASLFMNTLGQQMALARSGSAPGARVALAQACEVEACDEGRPLSAWFSGLGGLGSVQGDGNSSTLTYNVGGAAAGIDYRFDPRFLVGLGVGYTHGTQWVNSFMGQGWTDLVSVAAYGSFTPMGPLAGFYADALVGYAYLNNQLQRQIQIPGLQQRTASGSTGANQFLAQVETGYKLGVWTMGSVTPFARFQTSITTQNAFTELGASSLNLNVAQQTTNSVRTVLGAEFGSSIPLGTERALGLSLRLGWQHEYAYTDRPITASFGGAPSASFTVYGATPTRDAAIVGFSAMTNVAPATQLYLRYDGELASGTDNHALTAGLRMSW